LPWVFRRQNFNLSLFDQILYQRPFIIPTIYIRHENSQDYF
jgi:hypothetical protein